MFTSEALFVSRKKEKEKERIIIHKKTPCLELNLVKFRPKKLADASTFLFIQNTWFNDKYYNIFISINY